MSNLEPDRWPSPSSIQDAISRIQNKTSPIELLYTTIHAPIPDSKTKSLNVSVLDASFNPPTRAHSALALASHECDMIILLLSVSNADKKLDERDANYVQRVEMMLRLASSLEREVRASVMVMVINEPIFVRKQSVLERFLGSEVEVEVEVTWLVGYDALERLFSKRYYGDDEAAMMDSLRAWLRPPDPESGRRGGAKIVCALRNSKKEGANGVDEFVASGRIVCVSIGEWEEGLSSTVVRERIRDQGEGWKEMCVDGVVQYIKDVGLYRGD